MASSSSTFPTRKYDVFLSFRGEDTRKTIVSHLHKELVNKGIVTFKDDKGLQVGDSISGEITRAIQDSRFALVILSTNYASSRWCLDELVMIMDLRLKEEIKVIPIFYGVDPSNVRHQTGSFAFDKYHGSEMTNKVTNWKEALRQIAGIAGKDSATCEDEASMIEEIVECISSQLLIMRQVDFSDIVGMNVHMERLNPLLGIETENEVRMIGIWGMGGIGKTTIAKCLFDQFSREFPARCFLKNVWKIYRKHGVSYLQEKFLSTTLGLSEKNMNMKFSGAELGTHEMKARLRHRKVFVVLDNVDDMKQVHALSKELSWFGAGSRIIITTRDKGLLNSCGVGSIYEVKCLDTDDSLKIFNQLAFEEGHPPSKLYEKLSIQASRLAQGLPAAIEAYGLFFRRMTSLKEWEDTLYRFEKALSTNVMEILKISYDGLEEADKSIFLHVACLFNGEPLKRAITLLNDSELQGCLGVKLLAEKCLIEITASEYIKMHYLVEQTARQIVRQESVQRPLGRRVMWDPCEIYDILKRNGGNEPMECMALHMCEMPSALNLKRCQINYPYNLKFLKVYKHLDHIESMLQISSDDTNLLSTRLRLLHWDAFPLRKFPFRFNLRNLVEELPDLRKLDLTGPRNLEYLPDLSTAVNLEELITQGCKRLKRIPDSISNLTRLMNLDVSYCDELNSYHITIRELTGGRRQFALDFSGKQMEMKSIANLSIGGNIHIQMLGLDGNADHLCFSTEKQAPDDFPKREQQQAPQDKPMIRGLGSPMRIEQERNVMPEFVGHEWMMQRGQQLPHTNLSLNISMKTPQAVQAVPEFHGHKPRKEVQQNPRPKSKFHGFNSMDIIRFNYNSDGASFLCYSLSMFPFLKELNLINLNIEVLPDDVCSLQFLEKLDWSGNDFKTLPETINQLSRLKYASFRNCCKLKALPELPQLETIKLSGCINLQSLQEICNTTQHSGRFQWLELLVDGCKNVQWISDQLRHFTKLSYLDLSGHDFETLPSSITELSSVGSLCLNNCKKLKSIEGVPLHLKYLYAHGCEILQTVSLPLDHSIKHLDLSHCFSLKQDGHLITQFLITGQNTEESPRFACFPGTEIPSYFGNPEIGKSISSGLLLKWPSQKLIGFDACIMIACTRAFRMKFSPLSYNWSWEVDCSFQLGIRPDILVSHENKFHTTAEEEAVKSDHLIIFHASENQGREVYNFCFESELQFLEEFKSPPAEIKSCGVRLILEDEQTVKINLEHKTSQFSSCT